MSDGRWSRVQELFEGALRLKGREREAWLREEAGDDEALLDEVRSLLAADAEDHALLDGPGLHVPRAPAVPRGSHVGPYRIVEEIGEGGMGRVYLAERADGAFEQRVALKVIRRAARSRESLARFRSERQILADLRHTGIALLLDGGTTQEGDPYLVMEYVEGEPIDEYCRHHDLGLRERLELVREVCAAVQAAHAKLVIHRDLKPDNILVTPDGRPKLLDFGIAKLLGDGPAGDAGITGTGLRPMTPGYASPEQILGRPISTATDVYGVGIVLYELITGRRPYRVEGLTLREIEEAILEHDPPPPSPTVPGGTGRSSQDLDTIVLKALQKDPDRRYGTVDQLSEDLRRYLAGLPVTARPDTWSYRTGKFVRRHAGSVLTSLVAVLALLGFAITTAVQATRLERERDVAEAERAKAEAVVDFLVGVFSANDPNERQGEELTAREILARGSERVRTDLADQPAVQARVMGVVGELYRELGVGDSAVVLLEEAARLTARESGERSPAHADVLNELAGTHSFLNEFDTALVLSRRVLDIRRDVLGPDDPDVAQAWNNLGVRHSNLADYEPSEEAILEALRIRRLHFPDTAQIMLRTQALLGSVYRDMGRLEEGVDLYAQLVEAARRAFTTDHVVLAGHLAQYGHTLFQAGRMEEAERLTSEALAMRERLFPDGHPSVSTVRGDLAAVYVRTGQFDRALAVYARLLPELRSHGRPMSLAVSLNNAGSAAHRAGRPDEAAAYLSEAVEILRSEFPGHPNVAYPLQALGDALAAAERHAEAEAAIREALEIRRSHFGDDHPDTGFTLGKLGGYLVDRGRVSEGAPLVEESLDVLEATLEPTHPNYVGQLLDVGELRRVQGREEEAGEIFERVVRLAEEARGPDDRHAVRARALLDGG